MLIFFVTSIQSAHALPRTVTVILKDKNDHCDKIGLISPFRVKDKTFSKGKYILQITDNAEVELFQILERKTLVKDRSIEILPVTNGIRLNERKYAGTLKVRANKYLEISNLVPANDDLESVVGSELTTHVVDEA